MFIGKWNKSVILTYVGVFISVIGMNLALLNKFNLAIICLIIAGICDLFDGVVARKCKRNEQEKEFGVQIDSLADIVDFGLFPIIIGISLGYEKIFLIPIEFFYLICQIARLAYFNIATANKEKSVDYYQ